MAINKVFSKLNTITFILLFVFSYFIYTLHDNFYATTDSLPNNYTAVNLVYNHKLNLNNIIEEVDKHGLIGVTSNNNQGDYFSKTPLLNGIFAAPFYLISDKLNGIDTFHSELLFNDYYQITGKHYASFITSITVSLVFIMLLIFFKNYLSSLICTLIYAFSTFSYGTVSQGNWEHAPSFLLYAISFITLYYYLKTKKTSLLVFSTVVISISYFIRPLNVVFYVALVITLIFGKKYKHTLYSILTFVICFSTYTVFSNIIGIPNGYKNEIIDSLTHINVVYSAKVLIDLLFSPNYGLFFFYPIFIFSLIGIIMFLINFRNTKLSEEKLLLTYSLLVITAIFSLDTIWWAWPGGYSWGPRLLSEATIPMTLFINYFLTKIKKNLPITLTIIFLSIYGLFSNILCIYANNTEWHALYMGAPSKYLVSAWSKPNIIPFYLFTRRSLRTQILKSNSLNQKYFEQKTYLLEYSKMRITKVFETNTLLYTENQLP